MASWQWADKHAAQAFSIVCWRVTRLYVNFLSATVDYWQNRNTYRKKKQQHWTTFRIKSRKRHNKSLSLYLLALVPFCPSLPLGPLGPGFACHTDTFHLTPSLAVSGCEARHPVPNIWISTYRLPVSSFAACVTLQTNKKEITTVSAFHELIEMDGSFQLVIHFS